MACLSLRVTSAESKASKSAIAAPGFHAIPLKFKDYKLVLETKLNGSKCSTAATNTQELDRQLIDWGYRSIPMHYNLDGWNVPVEIDGVTIHLALASGANMTLVDPSLANGLILESGEGRGEVYGFGRRKTEITRHVARSVRFGDATYTKLVIYSGDLSRWGLGEGLMGKCSGALGIDLLSEGRAIIDCGNHRLYMLPPLSK